MPRAMGQIDVRKSEAILDAAAKVLAERGMGAPIEAIAKLAGVSKQTIYNHYGSKLALMRALIARRAERMAAPLEADEAFSDVEGALTQCGLELMRILLRPETASMVLLVARDGEESLRRQVYECGPAAAHSRITRFMTAAAEAGLLQIADPGEAAEFFIGMIVGQRHVRALLKLPPASHQQAEHLAREAARRFVRAYAPSRPALRAVN